MDAQDICRLEMIVPLLPASVNTMLADYRLQSARLERNKNSLLRRESENASEDNSLNLFFNQCRCRSAYEITLGIIHP
jgi:hypothetical protein